MYKRKKEILIFHYLHQIFILVIISLVLIFFKPEHTGFVVLQSSGPDFNNGIYDKTFYNDSEGAIQLILPNTYGTYTSEVFDAGSKARWHILSWGEDIPYKESLPNNQLTEDMQENLVLLHMDEALGEIIDYSGNNHHGTPQEIAYGVEGIFNTALEFNGVNSRINLGDIDELDSPSQFTIEFWFKRYTDIKANSNHQVSNIMFAKASDPANDNIEIGTDGTKIEIYLDTNSYDGTRSFDADIENNVWYHLALTYDASEEEEAKLYLNGKKIKSWNVWGSNLDSSGTSPVTIGDTDHIETPFHGAIDELAIYTRALTPQEILNHYKRGALNLKLRVRSCNDPDCEGESWSESNGTTPQSLDIEDNRYFQYKVEFYGDGLNTPKLYNIRINYTILNTAPTIKLNAPLNNSYLKTNYALLNVTIYDDSDTLFVYFYGDNNQLTTSNAVNGSTLLYNWSSLSEGHHIWQVVVTDGEFTTTAAGNFIIDTSPPNLNVLSPTNKIYRMHLLEQLDLNYSVTDLNLDSCWFTNLFNQNVSLQCQNTKITLPDNIDADYNLKIYANDSAGNINTVKINFSVDYSQGEIVNVTLTAKEKEFVSTWFFINSSCVCINDWCENVKLTLNYDTSCNLKDGYQQTYIKGDIEEGETIKQGWELACSTSGAYEIIVTCTSSTSSGTTKTPISILPREKTVYEELILGYQYRRGDNVTIAVNLEDSTGTPITGVTIMADIYYPNSTKWLTISLPEFTTGLYKNIVTLPTHAPYGDYVVKINSSLFSTAGMFQLKRSEEFLETIKTTITDLYALNLYWNNTAFKSWDNYFSYWNATVFPHLTTNTATTYSYLTELIKPKLDSIQNRVNSLWLAENCTTLTSKCILLQNIYNAITDIQPRIYSLNTSQLPALSTITNNIYQTLQKLNTTVIALQGMENCTIPNFRCNMLNSLNITINELYTTTLIVNKTASTILKNIENVTRIVLSDYGEITPGKPYFVKLWVFDFQGKPKDATTTPLITIYDPLRNIVVKNASMTKEETGIYVYNFTLNQSLVDGVWESEVIVSGSGTIKISDYWELESSPAEVKINSIVDRTIPTISADVTITNEGTGAQEYQYEYCVVEKESLSCKDNVLDSASGAKLIKPGESFNTLLTLDNVNKLGRLWFKLLVYFGSSKSGASQMFIATQPSSSGGKGITSRVVQPTELEETTQIKEIKEIVQANITQGEIRIIEYEKDIELTLKKSLDKEIKITNIGESDLHNVKLMIKGIPANYYTILPEKYSVIKPGETKTFTTTFRPLFKQGEYEIKFIVLSDEGKQEADAVIIVKEEEIEAPVEMIKLTSNILIFIWLIIALLLLLAILFFEHKKPRKHRKV